MRQYRRLVERIECLPDGGEGMTISEIAAKVESDRDSVVGALEVIAEKEKRQAAGAAEGMGC